MAKRLLLVHRYFWPDVPTYAQMLRFIGAHLAAEGNEVSVFCGPPSYNDVYDGPTPPRSEVLDGVHVHRVALPPDRKDKPLLRAISLTAFAIRLVAHVVRHRSDYDLMTVTTIPPVVMGVAARTVKRLTGIPYVYHCMDLYPEVATIAGMARNPSLTRLAARLDASTCRKAAVVVVLSDDMRTTLERRGLDCSNVVVLNNFEVFDGVSTNSEPLVAPDDARYRILFAGNMGRFQGLDDLMKVAHRIAVESPEVEFIFMGAGVSVPDLKAIAGSLAGRTVRFVDHQPVDVASLAMESCDLGVVSLRPRIYQVAYPSKTAMYLRAGCRLLAIVESDSDLAALIRDEDLGVTCPPQDIDALTEAVREEIGRGKRGSAGSDHAKAVGEKHFGREAKLRDWSRLVADAGEPRA